LKPKPRNSAEAASKPFREESDRTAQAAVDHLHHLIAAQEVAHEMAIPTQSFLSRRFEKHFRS
jgi:hypothetical protein